MSLLFAAASPSSLRRASSRSSAGVSSRPSPICRTYSFSGSSAVGHDSRALAWLWVVLRRRHLVFGRVEEVLRSVPSRGRSIGRAVASLEG